MDNDITRWVVITVLNIPLYLGLGWVIFRSWSGFWECVRFYFTPDWFSMIRGELMEDWWGTLKIFVFVALCVGAVYGEHEFFFGAKPKPPQPSLAISALNFSYIIKCPSE